MQSTSIVYAAALLVMGASAHGNITSPPARLPGAAMAAACGAQAVASVEADGTIPLESVSAASAACQLDFCRGATFDDNVDLVQTFTAGQVVQMTAALPIPHEGPMNVSIVDAATNTVIGDPLIEFDSYADESLASLPANNTEFSVTIPQLEAGQCAQAGDCVLQWFWFGTSAQQTYESCVDFVLA
ncbi:hypothetical protein E8E14_011111 [Neopestalotiopsis sp. 37M]|nr:hypothetical protein E8E14_011111 [Neopestalotiopsis sp. 37M]